MRIRSIRPEFWSSEDVAAMDWDTRLVFIGLWSYVDDNGAGRDVEALVVAALFPLDGDLPESSRRVTGALRHLSDRGQITRYEVDGKRYLFINAWKKHQRIEKASTGRYPLPTSEDAEIREHSPTTPGALPEPSTPGEGEKGRRGEGEKGAQKRATRIADDYTPNDDLISFAASRGFTPDQLADITAEFIDYWRGVSGAKGTKLDWDGTWRNWVRREDPAKRPVRLVRQAPVVAGATAYTAEQLDQVLGPPPPLPQPPRHLTADEQWHWENETRAKQRADRCKAADAKLGRSA
jgi:hypothetical protein